MKVYFVPFFIIISDILTKYWAHIQIPNISIISDWVKIVLYKNTGIAFSTPLPGIKIIIPIILGGLLWFMMTGWKKFSEMEKIGYTMIFTGGILNALERNIFGSVTDMIYVKYFAIFNIADTSVTVGIILLFYSQYFVKKNTQ